MRTLIAQIWARLNNGLKKTNQALELVLINLGYPFWLAGGGIKALIAGRRRYLIDVGEIEYLCDLAGNEGRRPEELAREMLNHSIKRFRQQEQNWTRWQRLSPREQQVCALICQNLTTPQIARRLGIAANTVDTHADNALKKFGAANRTVLRSRLFGWEFKP